ncbi:hypothetical protein [Hyalangium rubrum]|uniref:Uncharacterized protein n=1 Tax=Hyalangium rubrum TaxID=3103134 RepID=A0ABU5HCV6_9BACT|nr:hypothetical protein [Hyalangium sp. s54d21]MDY7230934.1 hypothetical protein [Hyalangium sp. s54d21]
MRLKIAVLSAALSSLLLSTVAFAAPVAPTEGQPQTQGECHEGKKGGRRHGGMGRMEHKLSRAVENGRLTQAQADQFKAEAQQLRQEVQAQRQASGGQLSEEQRQQFKQRKQALRQKVKEAMKATAPKDV